MFEKKKKEIKDKDEKIKANVKELKENCAQKLYLKNKIDEIKKNIKGKFEILLEEKKIINANELRNSLYNLIPDGFLENKYVLNEIEDACNEIESLTHKNENNENYNKKSSVNNSYSNFNNNKERINDTKKVTYLDPINNRNVNVNSNENFQKNNMNNNYSNSSRPNINNKLSFNSLNNKSYNNSQTAKFDSKNKIKSYEELEMELNKEILELVSAEKIRDNERNNILNRESDLEKKRQLNAFFTQERLKASENLLNKQK